MPSTGAFAVVQKIVIQNLRFKGLNLVNKTVIEPKKMCVTPLLVEKNKYGIETTYITRTYIDTYLLCADGRSQKEIGISFH